MIHRFIAAVRVDVLDMITAVRIGEYKYALPAFLFRRVFPEPPDEYEFSPDEFRARAAHLRLLVSDDE